VTIPTDCGIGRSSGDALDRAVADVAGGDHAGQAGLQQQGWPVQRPVRRWPAAPEQVTAGKQESAIVPLEVAANQSVWGSAPIMVNLAAAASLSVNRWLCLGW
jgi:hypothetical protein